MKIISKLIDFDFVINVFKFNIKYVVLLPCRDCILETLDWNRLLEVKFKINHISFPSISFHPKREFQFSF